jgi:hypothetical protein
VCKQVLMNNWSAFSCYQKKIVAFHSCINDFLWVRMNCCNLQYQPAVGKQINQQKYEWKSFMVNEILQFAHIKICIRYDRLKHCILNLPAYFVCILFAWWQKEHFNIFRQKYKILARIIRFTITVIKLHRILSKKIIKSIFRINCKRKIRTRMKIDIAAENVQKVNFVVICSKYDIIFSVLRHIDFKSQTKHNLFIRMNR